MSWQCVIGSTDKSYFISVISILSYFSKDSGGDRNHCHQHPHAYDGPLHEFTGDNRRYFPGQHQDDHPVHAHQCDQEDGSIHVGVAQIEETFAHDVTKYPCLVG